jgi:hypothetical protein
MSAEWVLALGLVAAFGWVALVAVRDEKRLARDEADAAQAWVASVAPLAFVPAPAPAAVLRRRDLGAERRGCGAAPRVQPAASGPDSRPGRGPAS